MGAKRCPRCSLINPPSAQRCECGFDFRSAPAEVRYELERQYHGIHARIVAGVVLLAFGVLISAVSLIAGAAPAIPLFAFIGGGIFLATGLRRRARLVETRRDILEPG